MGKRGRRARFAVLLICAAAGVAAAAAHGSRGTTGSYDGLIFRALASASNSHSGGYVRGCSDGLKGSGIHVLAKTLHASDGPGVSRAVVDLQLNGGDLVFIHAFGLTSLPDNGLSFSTPAADIGTCAPLKPIASSGAGDVYRVDWSEQICDNATCTAGHNGQTGSGCVALARSGSGLAATFQVGSCTPAVFPPLPADWDRPPAPATLRKGILDGMLVRVSGPSFNTMKGQSGVCGNAPKAKFVASADTFDVLRAPAHATAAAPADLTTRAAIGMDVNTRDRAYTWGGALPLMVNGGTASVLLNQSDPTVGVTCATRPKAGPFGGPLPVGIWAGKGYKTYIGQAWMKASFKDPGMPWSVLFSFGRKPDFSA